MVQRLPREGRTCGPDHDDVRVLVGTGKGDALEVVERAVVQQEATRIGVMVSEVRSRRDAGREQLSSSSTTIPRSRNTDATDALARDVVFVNNCTGRPAARIARIASTAPGTGFQDTTSTPSMSRRSAGFVIAVISARLRSRTLVDAS